MFINKLDFFGSLLFLGTPRKIKKKTLVLAG